jgi:hypothetical protein
VLIATGVYSQVPGSNPLATQECRLRDPSVIDALIPPSRGVAFSLVTGTSGSTESGFDNDGFGTPRPNANPCP